MKTTTYTTETRKNAYMDGEFEKVVVDNGEFDYTIDAFVGKIDYVKRDEVAGHPGRLDPANPYSVIDWLGHYTVSVFLNDEQVEKVTKEFYNLKDAVDFYLGFERGVYCEKVIYQERELRNGARDSNVVTYA